MKKSVAFIFAAVMSISAAARAADVNFDGGKASGLDTFIDVLDIVSGLSGDRPQPGHPGQPQHPQYPGHQQPGHPGQPQHPQNPGNYPGYPQHPGFPQHPGQPNHPGQPGHPYPPPPPYNPGWNHQTPPPSHYNFGGYRESCRTLSFNAQSPLSVTEEMLLEEVGTNCQATHYGGQEYCTSSSKYHKRKVIVNIGPRQLEAWETEKLEVCMRSPSYITADTAGMLYEYTVASRNDDGLFRRNTIFTLAPGAKKPAQPDGKELTMAFAGITTSGDVRLILNDNRANYFRGEKITITADGMNIPVIDQNMPVDQVLASFVKFNVTAAFDVAGSYELKLMDAPKAGKYVVTLKFFRSGPLSSGATATSMETFEIK